MKKQSDLIVVLFILVFSFAIWWPSRYLPYFWDSAGYVIPTSQDFLDQNFSNLVSEHTDFPHPPLFTAILAMVWKYGGVSRLNSHLLMFVFLPLLLTSSYFLVKRYTNSTYGLFAAALVGFSPAVLAEYVNIYVDLPSSALAATALALISYRKNLAGWIVFTAALLIKIPVITLLPFFYFSSEKKQKWWVILPLFTLISWLLYHYFMEGWFLYDTGRASAIPQTIADWYSSLQNVFSTFFLGQGKYSWTIAGLIGFLTAGFSKSNFLASIKKHRGLIYSLVASIMLFIITNEFSPRYALYFLPVFTLVVAKGISLGVAHYKLSTFTVITCMLILLGITVTYWRSSTKTTSAYEFNALTDLSILDSITTFRQMASTLQVIAPKARIYGGFPENQMLTQPIQGYVQNPMNFVPCTEFVYDPDILQIIIIHPYAPSQIPCRRLMDTQTLLSLNRFENNGKWVELYQVDASRSAVKP